MDPSGKHILDFEQIVIRNAERARYLLGVPASTEVLAPEIIQAMDETAMAQILLHLSTLCFPPISGVIAWHKNLTSNIPSLPGNWVECNGQVLNDPASPLHGAIMPDLNGGNRFLRGSATSGGTGGTTSHTHSVSTPTAGPSATVTAQSGVGATAGSSTHTHNTNFSTGGADGTPPYMNIVWIIRIK